MPSGQQAEGPAEVCVCVCGGGREPQRPLLFKITSFYIKRWLTVMTNSRAGNDRRQANGSDCKKDIRQKRETEEEEESM